MRNRNFIMVVAGQIISLFGNAVLRFALPLYMLSETGSAALFGIRFVLHHHGQLFCHDAVCDAVFNSDNVIPADNCAGQPDRQGYILRNVHRDVCDAGRTGAIRKPFRAS